MNKIITETDCNGYGKQRVCKLLDKGYKVISCDTKITDAGYYSVFTLIKKNWLERLFKL